MDKTSAKTPASRKRPAALTPMVPDADFTEASVNHATDTLVYAMGGLGEIGKNMYCFEHDDEIIIVDCGVLFPEDDLLGIDYVIPDYSYLVKNKAKIKALIITHGHEDHIGGIPFFLQQVHLKEIYAPRFAKYLIEKKLEEHHLTRSCKVIQIDGDSRIDTKYFHVGFFNTVHSIPDSLGILINTPNGRIVETGDFKFDLTPIGQQSDYQKMAYIDQVGVTLLMSDSTNSSIPGSSISERRVANAIMEQVRRTPGRLLVSTFASNVNRLNQILMAAIACNRKVAVFGRSMENVLEIGRKIGFINQLTKAGANVVTNSPLTSFHTTGHAPQEEQKLMLNLIKPAYFMPNHGEYKMLVQHAKTAQETGVPADHCIICSNGDVVALRNGVAFKANERIQTDAIYVDGNDASGLSTSVIKDRQILASSGLVAVIVSIDSRYNKILCRPSIVSRGFVYIKESQTLLKEAELIVYNALKTKMQQRTTFSELKSCIRGVLEPYLFEKTNRNPIVVPVILNQKAAIAEIQAKTAGRRRTV